MFGVIIRAAPQALFIALLSAVLARVLDPIIEFTLESPNADENDLLISGLQAAGDNFILVGLIALALVILTRAVIESQVGAY